MLSSDGTKSGGKPNPRKGRRAQNRDKARQEKRKAAAQVPETDQSHSIPERISDTVAVMETAAPVTAAETAAPPSSPAETSSVDAPPVVPASSEESTPVSYRAFADAWGNYSRTSLEQTKAYFEKLAGVRSLGAAFEVQAEFAKQACETFVAQSQRIGELQSELARQRLKRLEGLWRR
jgi:Phasin protein/Origin recognition complex subunit 6 (ORC6)